MQLSVDEKGRKKGKENSSAELHEEQNIGFSSVLGLSACEGGFSDQKDHGK